jgi:5-oxoprolinase (ATP-hydrolysing) subunit B
MTQEETGTLAAPEVSRETGLADSVPAFRWVTDRGLRLHTGRDTLRVFHALSESRLAEIEDLVPADGSLLVVLAAGAPVPSVLHDILNSVEQGIACGEGREHRIPVRFDGVDLPAVANLAGMAAPDLVERLQALVLRVGFLGFQPGFAYLEGLPLELHMPRLGSPRKNVPGGSVALGGAYCGIYPASGPGGWHLIGRTDVCLFDPAARPPARFQPGDTVRLVLA